MTDNQGGNVLKTDDGHDIRIDHWRISDTMCAQLRETPRLLVQARLLTHSVPVTVLRAKKLSVSPCGGVTIAQVFEGDQLIAEGVAVCSPHDNFNKKIGRDIATGRALKNLSR